jgi:P-type Cu+ transporter
MYNIILIPIAMGFFYPINNFKMDPMYAAVAMAMSSISVVTSSLFLKLYNPNHALK